MYLWKLALCTFLFVATSCEHRGNSTTTSDERNNSTVRYEINANVNTTDHSDDIVKLIRYNLRKNSKLNNSNEQDESPSNITRYDNYEDNEYEFHSAKDKNGNPMELRTNSTKASDKGNSTLHELRGNLMQVKDTSNLTLHEFSGKFYEDDKNNVVPYEMCKNKTCILLCCPIGNHLIKDQCVDGKANYPFPDVYEHATNVLSERRLLGKKLNEVFPLSVHNPCKFERTPLEPENKPEDEYMFLANGSLYQSNTNEFLNLYCIAALLEKNKYEVVACFEPEGDVIDDVNSQAVSMVVSLPFLLAVFVVYSILPELWNMHGYTLRGYVGSLFIAYLNFVIVLLADEESISDTACTIIAYIMNFFFLASFFWLNVMCFDIWWTFGGFRSLQGSVNQRERKKFVMYSIYAWGSASLLSIICVIMDYVPSVPEEWIRPGIGLSKCWFDTEAARALYFYGPMGLTVICNIYLFISTALKIMRHNQNTAHHLRGSESRRHDDNKQWFNLYLKLFIVMGISWSTEIISWLFKKSTPSYLWYATDLINALQGLIIFIIFVWKEKIKRLLLKRFGCQDRGFFSSNSTRSGCHSSASRTCTTSGISLQEKTNPYVQTNCRAKSSSDEAEP